jgi:hypothetical protein
MELLEQSTAQSLKINGHDDIIAKILFQVNQLSPFFIEDITLFAWSKSIIEILPKIDPADLKSLMRDFKTDEIHYDTKLGIQNVFKGLRQKYGNKYFSSKFVM